MKRYKTKKGSNPLCKFYEPKKDQNPKLFLTLILIESSLDAA